MAAIPPGQTIVMTASIAQGPCLASDIALFTPADAVVTITPVAIITTWINPANIPTNTAVQFNLILAAATPCVITGTGVNVTINGALMTPITVTAAATGKNLTVTFFSPASLPTTTTEATTSTTIPSTTTTTSVVSTSTSSPTTSSLPPTTTSSTTSSTVQRSTTTSSLPSIVVGPTLPGTQ